MVHTAVVLPQVTIERLKKSGRGMSEEIRARLTSSLLYDELDPKTRLLAAEIIQLAEEVRREFASEWHADVNTYKAFIAAVADQLESHRPTAVSDSTGTTSHDAPPETIGRVLARRYRRDRQELEEKGFVSRSRPTKEDDND